MIGSRSNDHRRIYRSMRAWLLIVVVMSVLFPLAERRAGAEGFVEPAFERQWRSADEDVARGRVSRTFFWGPEPFAHTSEVYAEGPNGQRRVQYFDKARMELTRRPGQDANLVTNGLLTVELVSGRLQVGDERFLAREPATNPVAGDPLNNTAAPTYASFNRGKLAFGVEGAVRAAARTAHPILDAVDTAGQVTTLAK